MLLMCAMHSEYIYCTHIVLSVAQGTVLVLLMCAMHSEYIYYTHIVLSVAQGTCVTHVCNA